MLRLCYNAVWQRWPFAIWSIYGIHSKQNHWKELKACWISSLKAVKPSFVFWDCSSESQIIASLLASPSQTSSWWIKLKQIQASEKSSFQQLRLSAIASIKTFQNSKPSTFPPLFFLMPPIFWCKWSSWSSWSPRFFLGRQRLQPLWGWCWPLVHPGASTSQT